MHRILYVVPGLRPCGPNQQLVYLTYAEMAKVIENTQRDLNIAFMNELALFLFLVAGTVIVL